MKKDKAIAGMFMSLLLVCSCGSRQAAEEKVTSVRLFTVENSGTVSVQDFPGQVVAAEEVNLAFKVGGNLMHVYVEEGDKVKRENLWRKWIPVIIRYSWMRRKQNTCVSSRKQIV